MNRNEKTQEVGNLKAQFQQAKFAVLTDYRGISVSQITDLRRKLREKSTRFKVIKNRLAKIAAEDTPFSVLKDHFKGTIALALTDGDPTTSAKILADFAKANEKLILKMAFLDGKVLTAKDVDVLAKMPSKEELIAKLMGSMQAPARNLVSVLIQIPRQLVQVLVAIQKQKEGQGS